MQKSSTLALATTVMLSAFVFTACGGDDDASTPPPGTKIRVGNTGSEIEANPAGLEAYIKGGEHRSWLAEPQVHDGTMNSPHGRVRVFFNQTAVDALRAGTASIPTGGMIVKELYDSGGMTPNGYAVMVKTAAASWTWWEALLPNLSVPVAFGVDSASCKPCHSGLGNRDQVRTPLP